jgi:hypothetical protein
MTSWAVVLFFITFALPVVLCSSTLLLCLYERAVVVVCF